MSEKLRGDAVLDDVGHVHKVETQAGALPVGHLSALRQSEDVLSAKLALLFGHVSVASEESRSKDVSSCVRYKKKKIILLV